MAHPANWILGYSDWGDAATLTASHEQTETPASNLQRIQPTDLWSSTNLTPYLTLDRGAALHRWNALKLIGTNADANATLRIRTASTEANLTASPLFDTGRALKLGTGGVVLASQTSASFDVPSWLWETRFRRRAGSISGFLSALRSTSPAATLEVSIALGDQIFVASTGGTPLAEMNVGTAQDMRWTTVSVAYSAGLVRVLIDGVLVSTQAVDLSSYNFDALRIGESFPDEADLSFVRYWNTTRSDDQILADHAWQAETPATGLLANFAFQGSLANTGSVGGALTLDSGAETYVYAMRAWPESGLEGRDATNALLWVPDCEEATGQREDYLDHRWLRVDFDWTGNAQGLVKVGRLLVGLYHQFARNPSYGSDVHGFEDATQYRDLPGGQRTIVPSAPVPIFRLPFTFDSEDELRTFLNVVRSRGASRDVSLSLNPLRSNASRHDAIGYGHLQQRVTVNLPAYQQFRSEVILRGLI